MSNNIEWASVDATFAPVTTTRELLAESSPDDPLLAEELGDWGAAIFAGDAVAIYADNLEDLHTWLVNRALEVERLIAERKDSGS